MKKGITSFGVILAVVILGAIILVAGPSFGLFKIRDDAPLPGTGCQDPGTARTVTIAGLDKYNPGTAVTGAIPFYYRIEGTDSWTASHTTFSATAGAKYEIALGLNGSTPTTDLPQPVAGPVVSNTVGCGATDRWEYTFTNDDLDTTLTAQALDPEDGNVVTATATIDLDANEEKTIPIDWYAQTDENYGTLACGEYSNICVVRVNTTTVDTVDLYFGTKKLDIADVPGLVSSAAGMRDYAFKCPVIQSSTTSGDYPYKLVLDMDDTSGPNGYSTNFTVTYYDSHVYLDTETNKIECGVEDEDDGDVGSAGADVLTLYTEVD